MTHYTYILKCADDTLYVGSTNDLEKRLHQHNNLKQGAHYTKIRRPVVLVYSEVCESFSVARKREAELKRLSRVEKLGLISGKILIKSGKARTKNISVEASSKKVRIKKIPSKYIVLAKVWKWEGDMAWFFINLDRDLSQKIREARGRGMVKISTQIGKSSWNTSLLYHLEAKSYLIAIKKSVRRKEGIIEGSDVKVKFRLI